MANTLVAKWLLTYQVSSEQILTGSPHLSAQ
jgi:hypothetical protein